MLLGKIHNDGAAAPPFSQMGYAIFVKLWDLGPDTPVDEAFQQISTLDSLMASIQPDKNRFFPNPYGGAVVLHQAPEAIRAAVGIMNVLAQKGIIASAAIDHGTFSRVFNVVGWNTQALALNKAARMATWPPVRSQICASPQVRRAALVGGISAAALPNPPIDGEVKNFAFQYHVVRDQFIDYPSLIELPEIDAAGETFDAAILVVDIQGYSGGTPTQQGNDIDALNQSLSLAINETQAKLDLFGPTGDGGYFVFPAQQQDPVPFALRFAHQLLDHAAEKVRIRVGLSFGPVVPAAVPAARRPGVGGTIVRADLISAKSPVSGLAISADLWNDLNENFKKGWTTVANSDPTIVTLRLQEPTNAAVSVAAGATATSCATSATTTPSATTTAGTNTTPSTSPTQGVGTPQSQSPPRRRVFTVSIRIAFLACILLAGSFAYRYFSSQGSPPQVSVSKTAFSFIDIENAGFVPSGFMGDTAGLRSEISRGNPHSRPTCQEWTYSPTVGATDKWAAVAWQFPANNFGDRPGLDWSKRGFRQISVWARGVRDPDGNFPKVQFKAGGNTDPNKTYHASFEVSGDFITLTGDWKQYSLDVTGRDLSQVIAAFAVVVRAQDVGTKGATFYLDDIQYQ